MKGNGLERDTLDGVIDDLEILDRKWLNSKNQMNYATLRDALHYLKEYRKLDLLDVVAFPEDDNPALTWEQLKQMEGKPVWIEDSNDKGEWVLLSGTEDEYLYFVYRDCAEYKIYRDEQGERWQAYRKERA